MLGMLKGTPWAERLSRENAQAILNFLRGGNWYYYKGFTLPCLDRGSYVYTAAEKEIPYAKMLNKVLMDWMGCFYGNRAGGVTAVMERSERKAYPDGGVRSGHVFRNPLVL